jgi:hypothetical protein
MCAGDRNVFDGNGDSPDSAVQRNRTTPTTVKRRFGG